MLFAALPRYLSYPPVNADTSSSSVISQIPVFIETVSKHIDNGEDSFKILVTQALFLELETADAISTLFCQIMNNLGITRSSYSYNNSTDPVSMAIHLTQYYSGKRIIVAKAKQKPDMLSAREKETLAAAENIIASLPGDLSALGKEKAINDYLVNHVEYYKDADGYNENDCAVGAILNGKADCDGYSDAFYLLATLAGLNVRHMLGKSTPKETDTEEDKKINHMWNLVQVGSEWVMLDTTWNDHAQKDYYVYYNIGSHEAEKSHLWNSKSMGRDITLSYKTKNNMRNPELRREYAASMDDFRDIIRTKTSMRADRICIQSDDSFNPEEHADEIWAVLYGHGIKKADVYYNACSFECNRIQYHPHFRICTREYDVLTQLQSLSSEKDAESIMLCLSGALGKRLFEDRTLISKLLAMSSLQDLQFSYAEKPQYVEISKPQWKEWPALCKDEETLQRSLDEIINRKPDRFSLLYSGSLNLEENYDAFNRLLISKGIKKYKYLFTAGIRLDVTDIQYS